MSDIQAVLHLKSKTDCNGELDLGARVIAGLTANVDVFPSPSPTITELQTAYSTFLGLVNAALNGTHADIVARNEEAVVFYNLLKAELVYVNSVGNNDEALLLKSGFDTTKEKTKPEIPAKVVIKSIIIGEEEHSAKINIDRVADAKTYRMQVNTVSSTSEDWTLSNFSTSMFKLYIYGMTRGQETWIRVSAGNSSGWGEWSDPVSFISK